MIVREHCLDRFIKPENREFVIRVAVTGERRITVLHEPRDAAREAIEVEVPVIALDPPPRYWLFRGELAHGRV